jgi:hypothetical protein
MGSNVALNLQTNPAFDLNLWVDTNRDWTSDPSGGSVLTLQANAASSTVLTCTLANATYARWITCLKRGGFRHYAKALSAAAMVRYALCTGATPGLGLKMHGVAFEEDASSTATTAMQFSVITNTLAALLESCTVKWNIARSSMTSPFLAGTLVGNITFKGCDITFNYTGLSAPPPIFGAFGPSTYQDGVKLIGCTFNNTADPTTKFYPFSALSSILTTSTAEFVVEACSGLQLSGTYVGTQIATALGRESQISFYYSDPSGAFRYENRRGVVDWNPNASPAYPTLTAQQVDGTSWSMRMDWLYVSGVITEWATFSSQKLAVINRLSTATRTVVVDVMLPSGVTADMVAMRVNYLDADGVNHTEHTRFNSSALTSGSTWNGASNWSALTAKKFSVTTQYSVKQGSEVACFIDCYGLPPTGANAQIFVNPEPSLS